MCIVHYCGSKNILPYGANREIIEKGLQIPDEEISALDLRKLISLQINVPLDHLKLYAGKELILLEDTEKVTTTTQLYFTIITCHDPMHCPSQVKIVTIFGQFRAPFTRQTTVRALKEYVDRAMKIPVDQQRYKFQGRILQDQEILSTVGIKDGSELRLDPKARGS